MVVVSLLFPYLLSGLLHCTLLNWKNYLFKNMNQRIQIPLLHAFLQAIFRKSQYKNQDFHEYSVDLISWKRLRTNNAGSFSIVICSGTLLGKCQTLSDVAQSIISRQFIPRWVSQKGEFAALMETYNKEIGYNWVKGSFKRDPEQCVLSELCVGRRWE